MKCSVRFRGREITHANIGQKILERVKVEVADLCVIERQPKLEGRKDDYDLGSKSLREIRGGSTTMPKMKTHSA